jgi:hypothetical protein
MNPAIEGTRSWSTSARVPFFYISARHVTHSESPSMPASSKEKPDVTKNWACDCWHELCFGFAGCVQHHPNWSWWQPWQSVKSICRATSLKGGNTQFPDASAKSENFLLKPYICCVRSASCALNVPLFLPQQFNLCKCTGMTGYPTLVRCHVAMCHQTLCVWRQTNC